MLPVRQAPPRTLERSLEENTADKETNLPARLVDPILTLDALVSRKPATDLTAELTISFRRRSHTRGRRAEKHTADTPSPISINQSIASFRNNTLSDTEEYPKWGDYFKVTEMALTV